MALALTNQGNAGPGDGDALAATLLDLIVRGRFKTRVGDGEHGPDLLLEQGDASIGLAEHEKPVVAIVESVLKDEPIPLERARRPPRATCPPRSAPPTARARRSSSPPAAS